MTIGERIKNLRMEKGLSQIELAEKIKVSKQTLYKYENNIITNIPSDKIESIAKVLDTTPSMIMGWEAHMTDIANKMDYENLISIYTHFSYEAFRLLSTFLYLPDEGADALLEYSDFLASKFDIVDLLETEEEVDIETSDKMGLYQYGNLPSEKIAHAREVQKKMKKRQANARYALAKRKKELRAHNKEIDNRPT